MCGVSQAHLSLLELLLRVRGVSLPSLELAAVEGLDTLPLPGPAGPNKNTCRWGYAWFS